ncbi:DUF4262 domain-containing protein [Sphingobacterium faecium]|uniref:DUF4262 domain-containing protein n=1 Tax=Sphingobacterium faecium TaxID=34087 RepID=UPI0012926404|nr:DUF4262 domain-containing protein [Sphingobacterium faecium]MQP30281.1 DUF4262 domain-containing protein [Sphingobacterium faecium]
MNEKSEHNCINTDDLLKETKINIDKFGLQIITVSASNYLTSFTYSIGLTETYHHPEIICFALPIDLAQEIINDVADLIKNGEVYTCSKIYSNIFNESKAMFIVVDKRNIADYFGAGINYYKDKKFDALQLVWTDQNDRFPWEDNFEEKYVYMQPLLDRNADFKFYEPKNLTTFTTRQWLEHKKPILHVVHDHDGDWQFLTRDQMPEDIKIVAIEELTKNDSTLNEIFDLEYGEEAERDTIDGKWTRNKIEYNEEK